MKLLEFKNYIEERALILKLNIIHSYQTETAYFSQGWGNVLSTVFWTLSYLVFVNVIFSNVKAFGGYSKNEVIFLTLIGQITFYIIWGLALDNISELVSRVHSGNLDLILTKPLPHLFYISFKNISTISLLRDGVPSLSLIAFNVDWSQLHIQSSSVLIALIIFICGQISAQSFIFLFSLTAFWTGSGYNTFWIGFEILDAVNTIPFEGLMPKVRVLLTSVFPVAIVTGMTASVLLNKSNPYSMLTLALVSAVVFSFLKHSLWKIALRQYSSASS
jgi:ABC-2 type transport system permease protein